MRPTVKRTLGATLAVGLAAGGLAAFAGTSNAAVEIAPPPSDVLVYGLVQDGLNDRLVSFHSRTPATTTRIGAVTITSPTGVGSATVTTPVNLVGIDVRPATGALYGLTDDSRVVTIDVTSGAATVVNTLTTKLDGTNFDIDFNPMADALRVVSDSGQDLRIGGGGGGATFVDGPLAYPATGDPRSGTKPQVRGAAYTNNVFAPTSTAIYDYDVAGADAFVRQGAVNPPGPNGGVLTSVTSSPVDVPATNTVTAATSTVGVGLDFEARTDNGYALLGDGSSVPSLYSFTTAGGFVQIAPFAAADTAIEDIAIASPRVSIAPTGSGTEGGTATVAVTRTGDTTASVTVPYTSSATPTTGTGGATPDVDYRPPRARSPSRPARRRPRSPSRSRPTPTRQRAPSSSWSPSARRTATPPRPTPAPRS